MKSISLLFLMLGCFVFGQDSLKWKLNYRIDIPKGAQWTCDNLSQVYLWKNELLRKYDNKGQLQFEQSFKRYGRITELDTKNAFKILVFSEQQQLIYYLDNALAKQQEEIDLSEFDLNYVTHAEGSMQTDKIWVFDQNNSTIKLLTAKRGQSLQIGNAGGMLDFKKVQKLLERNGNLFVIDEEQGLYQFDIYGSFVHHQSLGQYTDLSIEGEMLYLLQEDRLKVISLENKSEREVRLPQKGIKNFQIRQKMLFLEVDGQIFSYVLE